MGGDIAVWSARQKKCQLRRTRPNINLHRPPEKQTNLWFSSMKILKDATQIMLTPMSVLKHT